MDYSYGNESDFSRKGVASSNASTVTKQTPAQLSPERHLTSIETFS